MTSPLVGGNSDFPSTVNTTLGVPPSEKTKKTFLLIIESSPDRL